MLFKYLFKYLFNSSSLFYEFQKKYYIWQLCINGKSKIPLKYKLCKSALIFIPQAIYTNEKVTEEEH